MIRTHKNSFNRKYQRVAASDRHPDVSRSQLSVQEPLPFAVPVCFVLLQTHFSFLKVSQKSFCVTFALSHH